MSKMRDRLKSILVSIRQDENLSTRVSKKISQHTDDQLFALCFRIRSDDIGERAILTPLGVRLLISLYEHWDIKLTKPLSSKHQLMLMRGCDLPCFIDSKRIVVFESEVGVLLTLGSSSLETTIEGMFSFPRPSD